MSIITDSKGIARMASTHPKPEYPRPDLDRSERWLSLNGAWDFETEDGQTTITVPFAWETDASGVARPWLEAARYRREIAVPADWDDARVVVSFGAVHHRATVSIDGVPVGIHEGGYSSFEFDITAVLAAGESGILTVDVEAPADKRSIPHGKQRSFPRDDYDGVSFMPSSGIWQSVWLEARGRTYAASVALHGDTLDGFDVEVRIDGDAPAGAQITVQVLDDSLERLELVSDATGRARGFLRIAEPRLWSPVDPHLYSVGVNVAGQDTVTVTGGLRHFEARGEEFYLNGERFYMRGVLDQGYWPTTGITAPDDAALVADIQLARDSGFNLIRKHIKFEEPRWLHWADRMGMLVWAEPASTSRFSPEGAANFEAQIDDMVIRDGNHPSIIIWGLYNEEWGLDWDIPGDPARAAAAVSAYDRLLRLDSSRPIVENSGWAHVKTDLVDWHYYDEHPASWAKNVAEIATGERESFPVPLGPGFVVDKSIYGSFDVPRRGIPLINSEYGGGFTSIERAWHARWQTQELRRHDRFAGYVYTELIDVEHESAGLFTAERRRKDLGGMNPADHNAETVIIVDLVPRQAGTDIEIPVSTIELGVRLSHHGRDALTGRVLAKWILAGQAVGFVTDPDAASAQLSVQPFVVGAATTIAVPPSTSSRHRRLALWFEDVSGAARARTFVDAGPLEGGSALADR
jgi:hypothetical protein